MTTRPGRWLVAVLASSVLAGACAGGPAPRSTAAPAATPTLGADASTHVTPGARLGLGGCALFPRDHAFHADVRRLPVASDSAARRAAGGGTSTHVRLGFSSSVWEGSRGGIPTNVLDAAARPTDFVTGSLAAGGPWITRVDLPREPRFEGWPGRAWDRHLLLVDPGTCTSQELINVQPPGENLLAGGSWYADSVARIDLGTNAFPPSAVTASGLSMLSGLVRFDEVAAGTVDHALSVTLPTTGRSAVWPALRSDGRSPDPAAPPMGTWFRLRADADLSRLGPQALVVARALQAHGAVLADTGPGFTLGGEPDTRWNDADLATLTTFTLSDFDVVDPAPMRADTTTLRIR